MINGFAGAAICIQNVLSIIYFEGFIKQHLLVDEIFC